MTCLLRGRLVWHLVLFALLLSVHQARALPPGLGNLQWSDEFSASALDTSVWSLRNAGAWRSGYDTLNAVKVGGGNLTITTYTDAGTHYTANIGTANRQQFTYGYFESRIRFNDSPGAWSAFWLQSPTINTIFGDPATAGVEVDIVEHRKTNSTGTNIENIYPSTIHWDGYGALHKSASQTNGPYASLANNTWHTYGMKWEPAGYTFYFDGDQVWQTSAAVSARSQYVVLSTEVQNNSWAGVIPAAGYGSIDTSTTTMDVDYVRVYQLESSSQSPEPGTGLLWISAIALLARRRQSHDEPDPHV